MKSLRKLILGIVALAAFSSANVFAQNEVSVSLDSGFVNQYIWRGFELNGSVSAQPGVTVGYGGLSFSSWSNFATIGPNDASWTEHDFTLDYTQDLGDSGFSASVGWINYAFPDVAKGDGRYTNELYFGFGHDDILAPSITVYADVHAAGGDDHAIGMYYLLAIAPSVEVGKGITFDPIVSLGINQNSWWEGTGVSDINLGAGLTFPYKNVTFSPFAMMVVSPGDFGDEFGRYKPVYGAAVSFGF